MLLPPNPFSRGGEKLCCVKAIVIHWLANPMQRALGCRKFFADRADGKSGYGSAHYIVDLDGSVIRCIPEEEIAYHVGSSQKDPASGKIYTDVCRCRLTSGNPNTCTIGIEHCHTDWQGKMTEATIAASAQLCADLCLKYKLDPMCDLLLHKEVVGWKNCHQWYVDNPADWVEFKSMVAASCAANK